jgi:hypothetical protein
LRHRWQRNQELENGRPSQGFKLGAKPEVKLKHLILLLVVAAAYIALLVSGSKAEERSKVMQAKLEAEFKALPSFPRATKAGGSTGRRSGHGIFGASYSSSAMLPEIRAFYDSMLLPRGWHFAGEEPLRVWGEDLGGYSIKYHKGDFTASLQYAGQRAHFGWDYTFTLSWGLE